MIGATDMSNIQETPEIKHLRLKRAIAVVSFIVFLALMIWATVFVGTPLVRELFGSSGEGRLFSEMVRANPIKARLIYIGIQILQVFVALIPGEAVEIAGGLAFGTFGGLLLSLTGVSIGSCVIFLLTKTLGVRFIELFISTDKINSLRFICEDRHLNELVFILFFLPGTPKDLLTYVVGLTRMKLHTFLIITLIARIPSIITSTWGGSAIMAGDYRLAVMIFGVTALISLAGLLIYNRISKKRSADRGAGGTNEEEN